MPTNMSIFHARGIYRYILANRNFHKNSLELSLIDNLAYRYIGRKYRNIYGYTDWFGCFDSFCPSQHFFCYDGTGLPGLNQLC